MSSNFLSTGPMGFGLSVLVVAIQGQVQVYWNQSYLVFDMSSHLWSHCWVFSRLQSCLNSNLDSSLPEWAPPYSWNTVSSRSCLCSHGTHTSSQRWVNKSHHAFGVSSQGTYPARMAKAYSQVAFAALSGVPDWNCQSLTSNSGLDCYRYRQDQQAP